MRRLCAQRLAPAAVAQQLRVRVADQDGQLPLLVAALQGELRLCGSRDSQEA